ncbi:hypothetical protein D9756_001094 [Leucocoprinus leucothites]|uniref:O-methyltransferase C-terminal domain-containing protein n=1 Tax=Leucocoprinus leucothites TaxID=201217 RepID=A0A8H5GE43_9AGAR|nr:hypothetical protein D9756_001094 [Leucoagaricus leucothites]
MRLKQLGTRSHFQIRILNTDWSFYFPIRCQLPLEFLDRCTTVCTPSVTMGCTPASISCLVSLISNAASTLETYYTANSTKPYVPSLDDTEPHPLDNEIYPLDIRQAAQTLEGACAQLCATLVRPNHTILNKHLDVYQNAYLSVVLRAQIADILLDEPAGLPVSEISKRCSISEKKLARVLRTLCSQHIFREGTSIQVVAVELVVNDLISLERYHGLARKSCSSHSSDEPTNKAAAHLADTLLDPEWGQSDAPERAPFNRAFGVPIPIWHYFEGNNDPKAAEQGARFGKAMVAWNATLDSHAIITAYPWDKLRDGAVVNDVGGGRGNISMELYKRYPNLNLKLQDLPERTEQTQRESWPKECPQVIADGRIEFKSVDLFVESPIANCDIYLLKNVIHLMPDKAATTALSNVRKVMSPTSRVLVQDYIMQGGVRVPDDGRTLKQAQPPLLPNYGVGRIRQYRTDAAMMVLCNSQERTLDDFIQLGKAVGLEFVKVWDLGEIGAVEFAPGNFEK